jgi:tRNA modification GTPase
MNTSAVVACLTPPGAAAIATLAVRGSDAWVVCRRLFTPRSGSLPEEAEAVPAGRFWLGRFGTELTDEVVLAPRRAPPVPWLELHCHGGREVLALLLELFEQHGVRPCSWEEWQRLRDLSQSTSLQAEAAIALAHAPTARTASILLDQYHGALERVLAAVHAALAADDKPQTARLLEELTRYAGLGRHLTRPWRVIVAGAPNVGKSSLVNALAGFQRSVVAETPGTTRDVVTTRLAVEGWPIELVDTAGLRQGGETLEEQGIRLARAAAESADLILWVLEASAPPIKPPPDLIVRTLLVVNKIDLPPVWHPNAAEAVVRVSAHTGAGIAELCAVLARVLVPDAPPPGVAVPFTAALCDQIEATLQKSRV